MQRFVMPLIIGVVGTMMLVGLGVWQLQRMQWKNAMLAEIEAMLVDAPVPLPAAPDPQTDRYRGVMAEGVFTGQAVFKLDSVQGEGPGKRVIAVLELADGRRILVDRGIWIDGTEADPATERAAAVTGNLDWPRESDSFTPPPDPKTGLWFARDVPAMAAALGAEPVLIVARRDTGNGIRPVPLDSTSVPNNHWQYVVTWFLLALAWMGMTSLWLWRIRRRG